MAKIVGIIAHINDDKSLAKDLLNACFQAAKLKTQEESDPALEVKLRHIYNMGDVPMLASDLIGAKGAVLITHSSRIRWVAGVGEKLAQLDAHHLSDLYGKWFGLVVYGENDPWRIEEPAHKALANFNAAGLLILPKGFVQLRSSEDAEHLRLGEDLAQMIASQSEWEGHPVRSQEQKVA